MAVPQGIQGPKTNQICKLLKSLYDLKQASKTWYERLNGVLLSQGYKQSTSDRSLFTLTMESSFTFLLVYVVDVILASTPLHEFETMKQILNGNFKINYLGQLKYFLSIEVAHFKVGITIFQRKYFLDLIFDTCFLGVKRVKTPLDPSINTS